MKDNFQRSTILRTVSSDSNVSKKHHGLHTIDGDLCYAILHIPKQNLTRTVNKTLFTRNPPRSIRARQGKGGHGAGAAGAAREAPPAGGPGGPCLPSVFEIVGVVA